MSHDASVHRSRRSKGRSIFDDWRVIFGISLSAAITVLFLLEMYCGNTYEIPKGWLLTKGIPIGVRVTEGSATLRLYGYYIGECLVEYKVAGKSYTIWAPAGLMDRDRQYVADRLTACPVDRYFVYFNPEHPANAVTRFREDGS